MPNKKDYSIWTTRRNNWTRKERQEVKRDLEAAFVQAFIGPCYFCGGTTKQTPAGNWICVDCGRLQR